MSTKTRYIIVIDETEDPLCVSKKEASGAVSVLIFARTSEEAERLLDQRKTQ